MLLLPSGTGSSIVHTYAGLDYSRHLAAGGRMREIRLTQDKVALVDDEDFELVSRYKWHAHRVTRRTLCDQYYVAHNPPGGRKILLHNLIMHPPPGMVVDHLNFDGLDNRRQNLRVVTHHDNAVRTEQRELRGGQGSRVSAADVEPDHADVDRSHPLWRKRIVFTGTLACMTRAEAWQHAANCGAVCSEAVSRRTDYVVVGSREFQEYMGGSPSERLRKALEIAGEGQQALDVGGEVQRPRILQEAQFLELLRFGRSS